MPGSAPARRKRAAVAAPPPRLPDLPVLKLSTLEDESTEALVARGAALVREHAIVEGRGTALLRSCAVVLAALRLRCVNKDGDPDVTGTSHEYRELAREVYRRAGIGPDAQDRVQATVRYHVAKVIRENHSEDQLEAYGLIVASPVERQRERRQRDSAVLTMARHEAIAAAPAPKKGKATAKAAADEAAAVNLSATGAAQKATADHLRLGAGVLNILGQMSTDVIDNDMTDGQRAKLDEHLAAMQAAVTKLRRHTRKRRSAE
ncbi:MULTISPECIES: hypothetical protein [unclassified Streptomyces]|uniref:hypothetical protein n=1 Tax=unclassified Streptomyces TaxID=2593676 RepID=UPI00340B09E5